jgi:D-methionine transport system ATP-binding protein
MISIKNVSKVYDQNGQAIQALDNVSLHVAPGEIFGVVGPSGAGKSTLIRCVNLLERPTSGSVVVNGKELTQLSEPDLRRSRQQIGMIFQHFNLLNSRTVAGNVAFPLEIIGYDKDKRQDRAVELLDLVGLSDKANAYPAQLSGGQKQRVGIARALATEPRVLLSDEATSALDPQTTISILNLLKDLNQRLGLTILLITHEMEVVKQICDHVAILQDSKIVESGAIDDLITDPKSLLSDAFFPPFEKIISKPGITNASITFIGAAADQPVLATLVRKFAVDVNIIGGNIQNIGGRRIGHLQVEITGSQVQQALNYLHELGLRVEVQ